MVTTLRQEARKLREQIEQEKEEGYFEQLEEEERRKKKDRFYARLNRSGMEKEEITCKLQNFETDTEEMKGIVNKCNEFIFSDKRNLVIAGEIGTGKTHLACATAKKFGHYKDCSFSIVKCSNIEEGEYEETGIVILDDIGRETGTEGKREYRRDIITRIIEQRHRRHLRTIITTNFKGPELIETYGGHIYDRITTCAFVIKMFDTYNSYRRKK